jgi:hypothetical protein
VVSRPYPTGDPTDRNQFNYALRHHLTANTDAIAAVIQRRSRDLAASIGLGVEEVPGSLSRPMVERVEEIGGYEHEVTLVPARFPPGSTERRACSARNRGGCPGDGDRPSRPSSPRVQWFTTLLAIATQQTVLLVMFGHGCHPSRLANV